ncbi:MAG: hypothetical protein AAGL10_09640 [Pseudomonadota bacterium]
MPQNEMKHIFILCYGRTGSTVVQGLLNRLDGYCIRGERKWVLTGLAKAAGEAAKAHKEFSPSDRERGERSPHYGISEIDPDQFGKTLANTYTQEMLTPPPGTSVCGTKDVTMASHLLSESDFRHVVNFVLTHFHSSRIIFLTRRAGEVAQSGWWAKRDPNDVEDIVAESDRRFTQVCKDHPDRTFHLDYSEFKDSVEGFRRLLRWLGEPIDEEMLADVAGTKLMHLKNQAAPLQNASQGLIGRVGRKIKRILKG